MKRATVRDLHLRTSAILDQVAELRPLTTPPSTRKLPDRERHMAKLPAALDSGRILEQDRT